MKKQWVLVFLLIVVLSGWKLKTSYDKYVDTHMPSNTVVYYVPQHIYLHTMRDCPKLYVGVEYRVHQDTYGRMKYSKMSNQLCHICVPAQYIH